MSGTLSFKPGLKSIQTECHEYICLKFLLKLATYFLAASFTWGVSTSAYGFASKNQRPQVPLKSEESAFISEISANKNGDLLQEVINKENSDIFLDKQVLVTRNSKTVLESKQNHLIAQTDSSGVTGDTFGDVDKLRQQLLIQPIFTQGTFPIAPASTAGIPSGYGASGGEAYIGGAGNFPIDRGRTDGSLSAGFGLGDSIKSVGLEVDFSLTSVGVDHFGSSGEIGLKLHKYLPGGAAIAIGWVNPIKWGNATRAKETLYGVVSKSFDLLPNNPNNKLPLTVTFGLSSGNFRTETDVVSNNNKFQGNAFGGLSLRVIPQVSLVSSWTGSQLNVGASFVPLKNTPVVINTIFTDVTGETTNGLGLTVTGGYIFHF